MICFTSTMFFGTDDKTLDALIKKVAQKDLTAMERLYKLTKAGIYGFALSILKSQTDAEDVLHETYLSIWVSAHMYASEGKPMAWLITIAKNHCFKIFRNRKWQDEAELREETTSENYDFTLATEEKWILKECMEALNDDERQIIMLHAVSGFKYREIAEFLNKPLSTVLSKHHRGIKKLKEFYAKGGILNE